MVPSEEDGWGIREHVGPVVRLLSRLRISTARSAEHRRIASLTSATTHPHPLSVCVRIGFHGLDTLRGFTEAPSSIAPDPHLFLAQASAIQKLLAHLLYEG